MVNPPVRQSVFDLKPKMFFTRQRPPEHEVNQDVEKCQREHAPLPELFTPN